MFTVTRYCVQPFVSRRGRLVAEPCQQFFGREEAERAGQRIAKRAAGVTLFSVTGEPVLNLWREPRLMSEEGEVLPFDGYRPAVAEIIRLFRSV